jgi:hypothetical protein
MARGLNKVQIIGNLGRDPEWPGRHRVQCGGQLGTQRVSWTVGHRDRGPIPEERRPRLHRGPATDPHKYTANGGEQHTAVEIIANDLLMLSPREEGTERLNAPANGSKSPPAPAKIAAADPFDDAFDEFDDLPF